MKTPRSYLSSIYLLRAEATKWQYITLNVGMTTSKAVQHFQGSSTLFMHLQQWDRDSKKNHGRGIVIVILTVNQNKELYKKSHRPLRIHPSSRCRHQCQTNQW